MPRRLLIPLLGALALLLMIGRIISGTVVEQAWFDAMQSRGVWVDQTVARALVIGGAWLIATAIAFANLWAVRLTILTVAVPARVANLNIAAMIPARRLLWGTAGLAGVVGLVPLLVVPAWTVAAPTWMASPFGEYEGYFQHDVAFYTYWLPFERALHEHVLVSLAVSSAVTVTLYALTRSLRYEDGRFLASSHVRHHMAVLATAALLLVAWGFRLDAYATLLDGSGADGLFTRLDHVYHAPSRLWLAIITLVMALVVLRTAWMGQMRTTFVALTLLLGSGVVLREVIPRVWFGDRAMRESHRSYEETRALFTRRAFDVPPTVTTGSRAEHWRVSRSDARGEALLQQVWWESDLLARIVTQNDPSRALVVAPAWHRAPSGVIVATALVRDDARDSGWELVEVTGNRWSWDGRAMVTRAPLASRAARDPVVWPDASGPRFFPTVQGDTIDGAWRAFLEAPVATVALSSWMRRLAFLWMTRDATAWSAADSASSILLHRDVRAIVGKIAPFHRAGRDITPVLTERGVLWAVPLYMANNSFPLSAPLLIMGAEQRMFRRVATMLVHGATGHVRVVPLPSVDPLTAHWLARIPALILMENALPDDVRSRLPFGIDGAAAQLRTIARVHLPGAAADAELALPDSFPIAVPATPTTALAWSVPLVTPSNTIAGVLSIAARSTGTAQLGWLSQSDSTPSFANRRRALSTALDSATGLLRLPDDGDMVDGAVRPLPPQPSSNGSVRLARARLALQRDGARLVGVAMETPKGVIVIPAEQLALAAQEGMPDGVREVVRGAEEGGTPPTTGAELRRLYNAVMEAMRAGSWPRLGTALDSLGQAVRRAP